jgi:AraC-like DNA-binding protein
MARPERLYLRVGGRPLTCLTPPADPAAFHQREPVPALRLHAAAVRWGHERIPAGAALTERIVPDGTAHLLVDFSPPGGGIRALVAGARRGPTVLAFSGDVEQLGVELLPGAIPALFGVPARALADREVPLDALWGDARTADLLSRLADAGSPSARADRLEAALCRLATASRASAPAAVAAALRAVSRTRGGVRVAALADGLGLTARRLEQLFHTHVGLSPKEAARLARFHAAVDALAARAVRSWAELAAETGFADQSHLVQEFQAWAGLAPTAFLRRSGFAFVQD